MTYSPVVEARRRAKRTSRYHTDPEYRREVIARSIAYHRANPQRRLALLFKRRYGIQLEDYERMLKEQDGLCAICRMPEAAQRRGVTKRLAVDHDAVTGAVRGLLCQRCNLNIGQWNHDPEIIDRAAAYLRAKDFGIKRGAKR